MSADGQQASRCPQCDETAPFDAFTDLGKCPECDEPLPTLCRMGSEDGELTQELRGILDENGSATTQELADQTDRHPSTVRDSIYVLEEQSEIERRWDLRRPSRHIWVPTGDLDV